MTPKEIKMAELLSEMSDILQGAFSDAAKFARFLAVGHELLFARKSHPMAEDVVVILDHWSMDLLPNLIESGDDATTVILFREEAAWLDVFYGYDSFKKHVEVLAWFFVDNQEGQYPYNDNLWQDFDLKLKALKRVGETGCEYKKASLANIERVAAQLDEIQRNPKADPFDEFRKWLVSHSPVPGSSEWLSRDMPLSEFINLIQSKMTA